MNTDSSIKQQRKSYVRRFENFSYGLRLLNTIGTSLSAALLQSNQRDDVKEKLKWQWSAGGSPAMSLGGKFSQDLAGGPPALL